MKYLSATALFILSILTAAPGLAQTKAPAAETNAPSTGTDVEKKNVQAYIDLLREDVRQEKAELMGSVMLLSAADASKFWPIYEAYDSELKKLNDERVENIKEYARNYSQMTDEKADELVQKSMTYHKQRDELLAQTYDRVKQAVGATTAARFAQVENQLLLVIDLQIDSALPIVGPSSQGENTNAQLLVP